MKTDYRLKALVACVLFGVAVSAPLESFAQSKSKTSTARTAKAKKPLQKRKTTAVKAKAKAPKPGVVRAGAFRPLKNTDRMTVILQHKPGTPVNLTEARNRRTVFTERTVTPTPQNFGLVTQANYPTTAMIINSPSNSWWGNNGPASTSYYDQRYGWITTVSYSWGNVVYTYGYQVVNYWNGSGYNWIAYPGVTGVAYPVLYR